MARLKAEVERRNADRTSRADTYDIRQIASVEELVEAFDVLGAQLVTSVTHDDRRFKDLAERFASDRRIMLIVEHRGHIAGGALAFRRGRNGGLGATLRTIGLAPGARGQGLGRRLLQTLELEATWSRCHQTWWSRRRDQELLHPHGYIGRGSMMSKRLPLSSPFVEARLQKLSGS